MNFVSWAFVALFAVTFLARLTIGRRKTEPAYIGVLLVASLVFYGWHIPIYLTILVGTALLDFGVALAMDRLPLEARARRRRWLLLSLVTNLGLLAFFKYGDFAERMIEDAGGRGRQHGPARLGSGWSCRWASASTRSRRCPTPSTSTAASCGPSRNFPRFLLFISFFPQLVAGPIVRATEFLPQMPGPVACRLRVFYEGSWLLVCGFFLKMVCADNLAAYVDEYWARGARPDTDATFALWLGLMFSGQIFADFCGYSTIARGLGYLFGYRFPINFDAPYIAGIFKNFWERWHITLSRWLRDYLYVPLGGNRGSTSPQPGATC